MHQANGMTQQLWFLDIHVDKVLDIITRAYWIAYEMYREYRNWDASLAAENVKLGAFNVARRNSFRRNFFTPRFKPRPDSFPAAPSSRKIYASLANISTSCLIRPYATQIYYSHHTSLSGGYSARMHERCPHLCKCTREYTSSNNAGKIWSVSLIYLPFIGNYSRIHPVRALFPRYAIKYFSLGHRVNLIFSWECRKILEKCKNCAFVKF